MVKRIKEDFIRNRKDRVYESRKKIDSINTAARALETSQIWFQDESIMELCNKQTRMNVQDTRMNVQDTRMNVQDIRMNVQDTRMNVQNRSKNNILFKKIGLLVSIGLIKHGFRASRRDAGGLYFYIYLYI